MRTAGFFIVKVIFLFSLSFLCFAEQADDDWSDDWSDEQWDEPSPWHGFIEYIYAHRINKDPLFDTRVVTNELRFHLEREENFDSFQLNFNTDIFYDDVLDQAEIDLRELNIQFSVLDSTDIKIGRQISTWGTGDLIFINDLFPKDYESFFSGRDDIYLKAPANAVRINSFFKFFNIDFVWTPEFTADRIIDGERYSFYSPIAQANVGGEQIINGDFAEDQINGDEFAIRLYKTINSTEYALYAYHGYDKQPLGSTANGQATHHKKNAYGATIRGNLWGGLYNLETAYLDSKDDKDGSNPLVQNSQWKFLVAYEIELASKLTANFQYYLEWIDDYDELISNSPFPQLETDEKRVWLTNRITYQTMRDKLTWSLVTFYSPTDKDGYLRWNVNYRQDDHWSYILGVNILDGEEPHTFFAQFKDSSNIYGRLRYNF